MRARAYWEDRIDSAARRFGLTEGYKILFGPWAGIGQLDTVFLSRMPGAAPSGADLFTVSDERGNSYEVERITTRSDITGQFLRLAGMLGMHPADILTGTAIPFRCNSLRDLPPGALAEGKAIGQDFWAEAFALRRPHLVIACSDEARDLACNLLGVGPETAIPSGWGNTTLSRYRSRDGAVVVQLPVLSRFKLLSRPECHAPLRAILALGR